MNNITIKLLSPSEQYLILPLLGKCFPDYWEQIAVSTGKMPFKELSFAAFINGKVIGHCGIIPYKIHARNEIKNMAGIASVAVDHEFRKQGIARRLCDHAALWAFNNNFDSAPLYTAHFRVYESCSWRKLDITETISLHTPPAPLTAWKKGSGLTDDEKNFIISLYENQQPFDGKVIRQMADTLHSWARIFKEPDFSFACNPDGYAIKCNGVVVENILPDDSKISAFFSSIAENQHVECHLPEKYQNKLKSIFPHSVSSVDPMHGERPMVRDMNDKPFHTAAFQPFFPVTDKF